jgi:hypothetical protein
LPEALEAAQCRITNHWFSDILKRQAFSFHKLCQPKVIQVPAATPRREQICFAQKFKSNPACRCIYTLARRFLKYVTRVQDWKAFFCLPAPSLGLTSAKLLITLPTGIAVSSQTSYS